MEKKYLFMIRKWPTLCVLYVSMVRGSKHFDIPGLRLQHMKDCQYYCTILYCNSASTFKKVLNSHAYYFEYTTNHFTLSGVGRLCWHLPNFWSSFLMGRDHILIYSGIFHQQLLKCLLFYSISADFLARD